MCLLRTFLFDSPLLYLEIFLQAVISLPYSCLIQILSRIVH
jgi:hypothetical protein